MVITARTGFFVWLLAITLAIVFPATCAVMRMYPAAPSAPEPCTETVQLLTGNDDAECPPGAQMTTTIVAQETIASYAKVLIRCTCPRATPDAGVF